MSMTTAMDSIQMGNPSCVRWQHAPPLAAPVEPARESEYPRWEERELLLCHRQHTLLHKLSQQ